MKISVIIPVYNEKKTLKELLKRVEAVPLEKQLVIVDDFSTDGTRGVLDGLREEYGKNGHKIIFHPKNMGKGAAIRTAQAQVDGDIVIIQDADLEYNPAEYPNLVKPILDDLADVVYGSRYLGGPRRVLYFRHSLGNQFLTFISNLFTDLNLTDMETCYKVFKTDVFKMIPIKSARFGFEPEVTAKIAKMGARVYEIPISYNGRTYLEGKKIGWKDGVSAIWTIVKYAFKDDADGGNSGYSTLLAMSKIEAYNKYLFDFVAPYLGNSVLEIGSGIGNMSRYIMQRAEKTYLTEIEERYLLRLKNLFRHLPYVKSIKSLAEDLKANLGTKVDSVVCLNVLEHIEKQRDALSAFHHVLNDNGNLILIVPAHQWVYGKTDAAIGHYRRYSKKDISEVLDETGFQVVAARHINAIGLPGWFVSGRIFNKTAVSVWQIRIMGLLMPWLYLEKLLNIPFGLSLFVVARKK